MKKRALCSFDDKRYLLADGIHTLAFGHYSIEANVHTVEPADGAEQGDEVLTAAEARISRLRLGGCRTLPAGREPRSALDDARSTRAATLLKPQRVSNMHATSALPPQHEYEPANPHASAPACFERELVDFLVDDNSF